MRSLFFVTFMVLFTFFASNVWAADEREKSEMKEQVFNKALAQCIEEIFNGYEYERDASLLDTCLIEKGINEKAGYTNISESPKVHRMGAGKKRNLPKGLSTSMRNVDSFVGQLKGGAHRIVPSLKEERSLSEGKEKPESQKSPSLQHKYYLPSKKSTDGAHPIFLNR